MLIDRSPRQTCRIFSLPVGSPITALTVPPDADAVAAMDGDMHPATQPLPTMDAPQRIRLFLTQDDMTAAVAVYTGGECGLYVRGIRVLPMYGRTAPQLDVRPLAIPDAPGAGEPRFIAKPAAALPYRAGALLVTASTTPQTPPGLYRTLLELELEAGVCYLAVVLHVAAACPAALPDGPRITAQDAPDPLSLLFTAAGDGALPAATGEDYRALLCRLAEHDRRLYMAARRTDPWLTDTLCRALSRVSARGEDAAGLLSRTRQALVCRLDPACAAGDNEPLARYAERGACAR